MHEKISIVKTSSFSSGFLCHAINEAISIGIQKISEINAVLYAPIEKYKTDSVISIKIIETIKFHLLCFAISSSQTGFARTAITEHTTTKVLSTSSISSGNNIANNATKTTTDSKYVI